MIILSERQKTVYDFLWHKTGRGAFPWAGWVKIPGVPRQTVAFALNMLRTLGAISAEGKSSQRPRTYMVLVPSSEIEAPGHSMVMGARDARWSGRFDRPVKPDSGAFMQAVAGIIPPPDAHVCALGRFTGQRPDARAL